ncbi:MAG: glycerophosphodiester phosphodiesterase [Gemmatimonadetes bacterium]|nr:glycerophosphodiester phosphodiesterase [Gemmatimonadota bacterium]
MPSPALHRHVAALLLAAAIGCAPPRPAGLTVPYTSNVAIVAHRGASGWAPEHTIAAYDLALTFRADFIEQDLQRTKDSVLVILHDETLDRTLRGPGCQGRVNEHTLAELKACDAGTWFNERSPEKGRRAFANERVLTLDELFERYRDTVRYYIETKNPEDAPGMERQLLETLDRHLLRGAAHEGRVLLQSFSAPSLKLMRGMDRSLQLVQLMEKLPAGANVGALLDSVARYAQAVGPNRLDVDAAFIRMAHARCLIVHPYTVNSEEEMRRLARDGIDGMFTDYADKLRKILQDLGPTRGALAPGCARR